MPGQKILIVEDDRTLQDVLRFNLVKEGYTVNQAFSGTRALEIARHDRPDLIILDVMLPELSGLEVLRIMRRELSVPVILLTAKSDEVDKVVGLELGADDYVTKPFSLKELMARVHAQLRRNESNIPSVEPVIIVGEIEVDIPHHSVANKGKLLELTPKEFELLAFLARNKGLVCSREQLLDKVWGFEYAGDTRTVDVHIRWLRQKLEDNPASPRHLITVRGAGYKLEG